MDSPLFRFTLVIMDMVYTELADFSKTFKVVILVIMDMVYTGNLNIYNYATL